MTPVADELFKRVESIEQVFHFELAVRTQEWRRRDGQLRRHQVAVIDLRQHRQTQPRHEEERALGPARDQVSPYQGLDAVGDALVRNGMLREKVVRHERRHRLDGEATSKATFFPQKVADLVSNK